MDFPPDPDVLDRRGRYEGDGILVRDLYSAATVSAAGNLLAVIEVRDRDPFRLWYSYAAEDREEMLLVAAWRAGAVVEFPRWPSRGSRRTVCASKATVWHSNAWRAESYATPLSWERPDGWDPDVPVEWARYPVYRAREIQLLLQAEEEPEVGLPKRRRRT